MAEEHSVVTTIDCDGGVTHGGYTDLHEAVNVYVEDVLRGVQADPDEAGHHVTFVRLESFWRGELNSHVDTRDALECEHLRSRDAAYAGTTQDGSG